jgi:hypothetical protein
VDFFGVESFWVNFVGGGGVVNLVKINYVYITVPGPPGPLGVAHKNAFQFLGSVFVALGFVFVGDGQVHDEGSKRPYGTLEI